MSTEMTPQEIKELLCKPTITPDELLKMKIYPNVGRSGIYEAIKRGEIDSIQIGRKFAIITAPLRKKLCLEG